MSPAPSFPRMTPPPPLETHGQPIILIGLMGCGKTTVGKALSKRIGLPLLDTDAVIEEQIGKSISDIFQEEGEAHFRKLETALLRYLETSSASSSGSAVISTGGGIVLRPENRSILRRLGFCVWLNVELPVLLMRTARGNNRPLLRTEDRRGAMEKLLRERAPLYAETAHLRLDTAGMDVDLVARAVHEAAENFFARRLR